MGAAHIQFYAIGWDEQLKLVVFPPLLMTDLLHNLQVPPSNVRSK